MTKEKEIIEYFKMLRMAMDNLEQTQSKTGRTTAIIEKMKTGDMLIVHKADFGQQMMEYAKEKFGKMIVVMTASDRKEFFSKIVMGQGISHRQNIFVDHQVLDKMVREIMDETEQMTLKLSHKWDDDPRNPEAQKKAAENV